MTYRNTFKLYIHPCNRDSRPSRVVNVLNLRPFVREKSREGKQEGCAKAQDD